MSIARPSRAVFRGEVQIDHSFFHKYLLKTHLVPASILGSGGNCENTNKVPELMVRQVIIKLAIKHKNICKVALLRKHDVQLLSLFIIFRT